MGNWSNTDNFSSNNNDKSNNSYPVVLSKAPPSTAAPVSSSSVATQIFDNKKELKRKQESPIGEANPERDHKLDSESNISEDVGEATPPPGIMSEPGKPLTRTQRRKIQLENESSAPPVVDETDPIPPPKPRGRRGRKKKGSAVDTTKKVQGSTLKVCANCGTVADKVKAKKCHKCQKFFFDHWARRCRIPPCPNCHFSRKSRGCEAVPQFCERCGHALKGDSDDQRSTTGEANSLLDSASDTSSFHLSEDFHDVDNLSHSRDSEDDEECVAENVGEETLPQDATDEGKTDMSHTSDIARDNACESPNLADEEQGPTESHDLSSQTDDLAEKSSTITSDEINPPPLPVDDMHTIGERDVDSPDKKCPVTSDTNESKIALQESVESVDTKCDKLANLDSGVTESLKANDTASSAVCDDGSDSKPLVELQTDFKNDESMQSPPNVMLEYNNSVKEAEVNKSEEVCSHQTASLEQLQSGLDAQTTLADANSTAVKDQVVLKKINADTKRDVTSSKSVSESDVESSITEKEGAKSASSLVHLNCKQSDHEETPTPTSVKKRKRSYSPEIKKKTFKKSTSKPTVSKSPPDCSPISTPGERVLPPLLHSPNHSTVAVDNLKQQRTHSENPDEPAGSVPEVAAHEVEALRSVPGTSGLQTDRSMTQLLHQAQNVGTTMTNSLQPLLKNLMENLMQQKISHQIEVQSTSLELLQLDLKKVQVRDKLIESNVQQQNALIHQQIMLSQQCQQLINQLQSQVSQQKQIKTAATLLNQSSGLTPASSSSSINHLPQKRCEPGAIETASEESEPKPSSNKKRNTLHRTDTTSKVTPSNGTTPSPVPLGNSMTSGCLEAVEHKDYKEPQKLSNVVSKRHSNQSSSKLVPRSASLPPQLVPSSSLNQPSDDDANFLLSSAPCIAHTLPPPPLKPTPPVIADKDNVILLPVKRNSVPLSSLPSAPPDLKLVPGCSVLLPPLSAGNVPLPSVDTSRTETASVVVSGGESSVVTNTFSDNATSTIGAPVVSASSHVISSEHFQCVKSSLSSSQSAGSFHRLEIGSPPPISGQSNKIRISLLKPEEDNGLSVSNVTAHVAQSPVDAPPTVSSTALPGKFQNFALSPNLSVIATVETPSKMQVSAALQTSRLSPINSEVSAYCKPPQLKSDSQELQRSLEGCPDASTGSRRQCTTEELEELGSNIQRKITSVLNRTSTCTESLTPSTLSQPQFPALQPPQVQLPPLFSQVPSLPVPGRGAVSITVIKNAAQSRPDPPYCNTSVQTTTTDNSLVSSVSSSPPITVSSSSSKVSSGLKMSTVLPLGNVTSSLTQSKPYLLSNVSKDIAGLPSLGVQPAPTPTFRKIAPRKPCPSGIVTIQVCNTIPNSNSVTAAKMTSQSVGVGTEPSASQPSGVRMTPSIVRPRPSAQIGGVLVTPQPSGGHMNPHIPPSGQGASMKPPAVGGSNGEAHGFPCSPPSRSVYVTKLYSNVPSSTVQTGPQTYNPHSRSGLKELSSPAFEEALISAAKLNAKQFQEELDGNEKPLKKERKRGGKLKAKEGRGGGKGKKGKGKFQGDKGEKFKTDKALARLMSDEVLENEWDQISETGSHNGGDKSKPSDSGEHDGKSEGGEDDVSKEESSQRDEDNENGENEDEKSGNAPKKDKNGSKKDSTKLLLYSVKLKDCFLHHMVWQDYRVVLLVPLNATGSVKSESPGSTIKSEGAETTPPPERKRRRKSKIETLDIHEIEAEMDPLVESPATSSSHIHSPCFSVYELRNKLFSESNAVYAYTYKNQIKTLKPPLHWVHVLKRMGGMQENCHTCRLLDVGNVKGMSQHYGNSTTLPSSLDDLCRNELPVGRRVIDLSSLDPEELLDSGKIEEIPQCSFIEKPSSKKKATTSRKRQKKQLAQTSAKKPHNDPDHETVDDFFDQQVDANQSFDLSSSQSDLGDDGFEHDPRDSNGDDEGRLVIAEEESATNSFASTQRSPPPLIKHSSPTSIFSKNPQKKKFCPDCGIQIARKCKKCPTCGKRFGVFTFGRKLCPGCGRVNLARMTACYDCGHTMQFAQKALPKGISDDAEGESKSDSHHQSDYVFGSRKRRRIPALSYPSEFGLSPDASKVPKLHVPEESSSRLSSIGDGSEFFDGDGIYSEGRMMDADDSATYDAPEPDAHSGKKSKHLGYQYGRVPWGDADITCLVDENGTPKFCLQELCSKVLRNQVKADVFDMVKNLNLPVLQGDTALLKKLQALGLHSNRSPICRLIAAEELWTLLDALQEPVPEEVHQHLENISSSTTPLMQSPSHIADGGSSGAVLQSPGLVAGGSGLIDEDEHGFESTLHEMKCSDGQFISILRTWNGEQYACLTEVWRKYFPEVNRNHLTSALKRLGLDTHMPTGQQATLLRSAGVISLRGAAGRLMRLEDTQMLLDDFGIPLQINSSSDSKEKSDILALPPPPPPVKLSSGASITHISKRKMSAPGCLTYHTISPVVKLEFKDDAIHAQCMRNILTAISHEDLVKLLEKSQEDALSCSTNVDEDASAVTAELDGVQQLIHSRRDLCNILSNEIGYLTASNHAYMAEVVRLNHSGKQIVQDLESSLLAFNISL